MAGLIAIYANEINVHSSIDLYENNSVLNYIAPLLFRIKHRGNASWKFTVDRKVVSGENIFPSKSPGSLMGKLEEIRRGLGENPVLREVYFNQYETYMGDLKAQLQYVEKLRGLKGFKGTGLFTKVNYEKVRDSISEDGKLGLTSADGYLIMQSELNQHPKMDLSPSEESFKKFDRIFSQLMEEDPVKAQEFANERFNGALAIETKNGVAGLITKTKYKQMFLIEAKDENNSFNALVSEDCVADVFSNGRTGSKDGGPPRMDIKIRPLKIGELVVIDRNGPRSYYSGDVSPRYDPHEPLYMLDLNSTWNGESVVKIRKRAGRDMGKDWKDHMKEASLVGDVPDEPKTYVPPFSEESGIPFDELLIKDRFASYKQRNYSQRGKTKLYLNDCLLRPDMTVGVIDDSIIEGHHLKEVLKLMSGKVKKIVFMTPETAILKERQADVYSETWELIARKYMSDDIKTLPDLAQRIANRVSEGNLTILYREPIDIAKSLQVDLEHLEIPEEVMRISSK